MEDINGENKKNTNKLSERLLKVEGSNKEKAKSKKSPVKSPKKKRGRPKKNEKDEKKEEGGSDEEYQPPL